MVLDDCKMGIADDLQTCYLNALGFVCDGAETNIFCWESTYICSSRFKIVAYMFQFGLQLSPCLVFCFPR